MFGYIQKKTQLIIAFRYPKIMASLLNSINLSPNNSMTSNFILDKIFPQTEYQANQNKNYYDYSVVFFFNNDSDDFTTKKIDYGFGYVFYELNSKRIHSFSYQKYIVL